jgi:NADH:ubiquinone oxidoreductase subunit 6 (subunit J)
MNLFPLSIVVSCALLSISVSGTRNPFMALMYTVLLFINVSFVLLMLGFEFLALVNLLVYVGALAVLFLFVIMLLEIPATELRAYQRGWGSLCFVTVCFVRVHLAFMSPSTILIKTQFMFVSQLESMHSLGQALFLHYADLLILNSLVLTVALFGALVLAHMRYI